ncbi:NAD kinase 2, mitochondrial isoform X1 [Spodoptera frugiperda]|uniref:NAD(+) kinase n=2 Tax=Spodoptera frugiperda TaxID=7108 RepID=A0A9R0F428_SPOFR|nr:NAD kinase 2, mitochondrial isoform X1 [Spodoptera frugiperda]
MSVLNNFTVSVAKGLRRLRQKQELREVVPNASRRKGNTAVPEETKLNMEKCLIVSKVTRYEYERHSHEHLSECELERVLRKRGSDYDSMLKIHKQQKAFEENVAKSLRDMGLKVEMASRLTYNDDIINWCDVVVPCGGDGTFLLAASRVRDANKPVIGFNSSPQKSVGRLCLPTWCSNDVKGAFQAIKEGRFRWMRRSRIRTTVTSEPQLLETITPVDLHTLHYCRYPPVQNTHEMVDAYNMNSRQVATTARDAPVSPTLATKVLPFLALNEVRILYYNMNSRQVATTARDAPVSPTLATKVLPFLALNEVFIGESVTSRVSLLRLQIDNGAWSHTKSSGLCVTTGTGSTSWHFSINCLRTQSVQELMKILHEEYKVPLDTAMEKAREVTEKYNQKLMFAADSDQLAYSVREYITFEEWPTPRGLKVRDKASSVKVKSHCTDAGLVIDGSVSFPFNDGTEAILEIHPEDSLMTVQMDEKRP